MSINTTKTAINHVKSVTQSLQSSQELPFTNVLSTQILASQLGDMPYRERIFSPDVVVFGFLSQVMGADQSCQSAVAQIIAHSGSNGQDLPSANTSAYCQARARLPVEVLSGCAQEIAHELEQLVPSEWLWRGRHIKMPDGSTISMPDTEANQALYPQPDSQKDGVGFPIARVVVVNSLSTGAVLDIAIAPYSGKKTGEHALLRQLLHNFVSGDIVLGDEYYGSYFLMATLMQMGVDCVFPQHNARKTNFRKGKRLGKKDHVVQLKKPVQPDWMDAQTYANVPDTIMIREVQITYSRPGFKTISKIMITTFTCRKDVSAADLSELYGYRWFVELDLRSIKDVMRMDILRGKTPSMVHKEIWAHLLAYNLVRKIMAQSAVLHNNIPREMSFKLALQMMNAFRQAGILHESGNEIYLGFLKAIAYKQVGNRPGRNEPRMIKRRPKSTPRLQKHRDLYRKKAA